jgi:hypothetical protein
MDKKGFLWWIVFVLLFIWQLPQNIIALFMMPFLGKLTVVRSDKYCIAFKASKMMGGITLGSFIFLSNSCAQREEIILHEYGHVIQSHMLSWLYLIVIGLPSIINAWFDFTPCYYDWYTEAWANKLIGLEVDEYCRTTIVKK